MHVERFLARAVLALAFLFAGAGVSAQVVATTTVSGSMYQANGAPASGTLQISWPAFTTAAGQAVAAGRLSAAIGGDGKVSVALAPNVGAMPAGLFYTAVYHLSDGTTSTEYWVVPNTIEATIGQVRSTVMPAAQAVQAVNKAYVDQSIAQAVSSQITPSGGTLTGPLYLAGDPTQTAQAANKHYVDQATAQLLPLSGGMLSGPVTAPQIGAVLQADQFAGADFGAQLQACVNALDPAHGGTCDARNFAGQVTMASNLTLAVPNVTIYLPCSTIATSASIVVPAGTRNVSLHGCASRGTSAASGVQGGTVLLYSGSSALLQVGDATFGADTKGFRLDSAALNTTAATAGTAQAMAFYRTQEIELDSLYVLGNANQTGLTLDGTGNYTGGTFENLQFTGFQTAVNGVGHTVDNSATTDWLNASTFVRVHIDCPTQNGSPMTGTTGINLQAGDGNTFTGGDVEGCATALHLGAHAQNNTLVGVRNENSTTQVQADAGSGYNDWITGGTMFTGKLVDNGTRNSFLDTFHRAFNGMNGDWYGSQQDATVTNHFRLGTGTGKERGLLNRFQTDAGYRWTTGLSDAAAGIQYYQVLDELNNVYRLSLGQYNSGQGSTNDQTVLNAAGTGAVILNGSNNAGTGGVVFGSGGPSSTTVATIDKSGNANFTGTLQVGGASQSTGTLTVRNNADAEVDYFLWPGATASQKGSFTYKDFNGASQWYLVKDQQNNWALNSAVGGLDALKAYQSTNSGDTYINAAKATGHIRLNYETGAGAETDIYSGGSAGLTAAFLGPTAIKLPGLAAANAHNCMQIDSSGYLSNTGAGCGAAASVGTAGLTFSDGSVQTSSQQGALTGAANDATARTAAATAETDAQTGITNAAAAQTSANNALSGQANDAAARAAAGTAQSAANEAEADAQTGMTNAAAAQTSANNALNGQANDAAARTAAATAEADAQTGITNAAAAQSTANQAEADAQTGRTNAAAAQTSANNALSGQANDGTARTAAATAETDAQTGITNSAAAQTSANNALSGQANDGTARTAAGTAEADAQTGITNAAAAQSTANQAETDAQTAITNAAAAQQSADAALGTQGATSTGTGSGNVVAFPGTITVGHDATSSGSPQQVATINNLHNLTAVSVTEYGAVGDCTANRYVGGGTTGTAAKADGTACSDNKAAIQAAIDHCYAYGCAVYFPASSGTSLQTVYWVSGAVNPKGVSLYAPPGAGGQGNGTATNPLVAVRGAAGADVFAIPDPTSAGYVAPLTSYSVRDLAILFDNSVDASSSGSNSFPHRFPGRTVFDGAMTAGGRVLTSSTALFHPGDVGQAVSVAGAGAGGSALVSTIAGWTSANSVTLGNAASVSVSNAKTYVSVFNLPATQTIGNCAWAEDAKDFTATALPERLNFDGVVIRAAGVNSSLANYTCGFFFQGAMAPYQSEWKLGSVSAVFPFAYVPADSAATPSNGWTGLADYDRWDHEYILGTYSFLAYSGSEGAMRDVQIGNEAFGPQILQAYGVTSTGYNMRPDRWELSLQEIETTPSLCSAGPINAFRIEGSQHVVPNLGTPTCSSGTITAWWEADDSRVGYVYNGGLNDVYLSGSRNVMHVPTSNSHTVYHNTSPAVGNAVITFESSNPFDGIQPLRAQYAGLNSVAVGSPTLSRGAIAFDRTADFLQNGGSQYYLNNEDLWLWPGEVGNSTGSSPAVVTDAASDSGSAISLPSGSTATSLYESNGIIWTLGSQIPAGKLRLYVKAKADGATSFPFDAGYSTTSTGLYVSLGCGQAPVLTTSYAVYACDVDATGLDGDNFRIRLGNGTPTTANVSIAWMGLRPWKASELTQKLQIGSSQAIGGVQGSTGTKVLAANGSFSPGNAITVDSSGNAVDSGISIAGTLNKVRECNATSYTSALPFAGVGCGNNSYSSCSGATLTPIPANVSGPKYVRSQAPSGTAPQCAGWSGTNDYWSAAYPALMFDFLYTSAGDFAVARTWLGLAAGGTSTATMEAADTPAFNFAGLRYSTAAGDTHLMCVAATASGMTAVDTGITPAALTMYVTEIDVNASSVVCKVNGAVTTNSGAYQPGGSGAVMEEMYVNAYPSGSTQVQIGIGGMKGWEQGRSY